MVIVDEAHNARTPLSFETLQRFDPSLILELTATPQLQKDVANEVYPSNVLFHVSAAELKAEEMIKLPIRLNTDTDWRKVIGQALDCQKALEDVAVAEGPTRANTFDLSLCFRRNRNQKATRTD